jgi:hypothetical protein
MTRDQESELFQHLVRNPRMLEWVQSELEQQIKVLLVNSSMEQLMKAQGAAAVYKTMQDKLQAAKTALTK